MNNNDACRMYCGMRANFDGSYLVPRPGCLPHNVRKARENFAKLYQQKAYQKAKKQLKPILENCRETLYELYEEGRIRNDLADV